MLLRSEVRIAFMELSFIVKIYLLNNRSVIREFCFFNFNLKALNNIA